MVSDSRSLIGPPPRMFDRTEQRKTSNFLIRIVEKGDIETVEIGLIPFLAVIGTVLACFRTDDLAVCGAACIAAGAIGATGLFCFKMALKMLYGVVGAAAQIYVSLSVVQTAPGDIAWVATGAGALACFWIASRASKSYFRGV